MNARERRAMRRAIERERASVASLDDVRTIARQAESHVTAVDTWVARPYRVSYDTPQPVALPDTRYSRPVPLEYAYTPDRVFAIVPAHENELVLLPERYPDGACCAVMNGQSISLVHRDYVPVPVMDAPLARTSVPVLPLHETRDPQATVRSARVDAGNTATVNNRKRIVSVTGWDRNHVTHVDGSRVQMPRGEHPTVRMWDDTLAGDRMSREVSYERPRPDAATRDHWENELRPRDRVKHNPKPAKSRKGSMADNDLVR